MSAKWLGIFAVFFLLLASSIAFADPDAEDGPLQLTMDQTQTLHLEQAAASVIINNPDHVSATLDNPRLLILTPHQPGTTSMIILDGAGKTILQQDIVVTNVQPKHVRIRRMCSGGDGCAATSYSYCPDGCYEVTSVPSDGGNGGGGPPAPAPAAPHGLIEGEPAETLIGPADDCPEGYNKVDLGIKGDMHYTCTKR